MVILFQVHCVKSSTFFIIARAHAANQSFIFQQGLQHAEFALPSDFDKLL
jgi:hypothetical protein